MIDKVIPIHQQSDEVWVRRSRGRPLRWPLTFFNKVDVVGIASYSVHV